jgi:hypothetical protein
MLTEETLQEPIKTVQKLRNNKRILREILNYQELMLEYQEETDEEAL